MGANVEHRANYKMYRNLRRRVHDFYSSPRDRVNTYLTTILSAAMLVLAYAQYRTTEKQTEISDALARLEYAKASARFKISLGPPVAFTRGSGHLESDLPAALGVQPVEGVRDTLGINANTLLYLSDLRGGTCTVSFRGLYAQGNENNLVMIEDSAVALQEFVYSAAKEGVLTRDRSVNVMVLFVDLFGEMDQKVYSMDGIQLPDDAAETALPIYAGAWSGGRGLYFNEGDRPEAACPKLAGKIREIVERTGGKAGPAHNNLGPAIRNMLDHPDDTTVDGR